MYRDSPTTLAIIVLSSLLVTSHGVIWFTGIMAEGGAEQGVFLTSNKGGRKMFFRGYSYIKKSSTVTNVYWSCAEKVVHNCTGSLKTLIDLARPEVRLVGQVIIFIVLFISLLLPYYYF